MKRLFIVLIPLLTFAFIAKYSVVQAAPSAPSGVITVTSNASSGAGTLRQAIIDAAPGDIIRFDGDHTIILSSELPDIDFELTIDGEDNNIVIRGNATTRSGFEMQNGANVTLRNLIFENGSPGSSSVGGGAIDAFMSDPVNGDFQGKLLIEGCTFRNNSSQSSASNGAWDGGAIYAKGAQITIRDSHFEDNVAGNNTLDNEGGAIYLRGGHLVIERTTFEDNDADLGGAIWINGDGAFLPSYLEITDSTFIFNSSRLTMTNDFSSEGGGAIYIGTGTRDVRIRNSLFDQNTTEARGGAIRILRGTVASQAIIENTTFHDNHAKDRGGALYLDNTLLNNVTIVDNTTARQAGGVYASRNSIVRNSIIANNAQDADGIGFPDGPDDDCAMFSAAFENTLIETIPSTLRPCLIGSSAGNLPGVDPQMASFSPQNNGGETNTIALNAGSPALGAGNLETCSAVDQRGYIRTGSTCDIGAYEDAPIARCATWDGVTQRTSTTGQALWLALAANTGNDIKIAGVCEGVTNVGNVIGGAADDLVAAHIDQSITLEGGHRAFDWNMEPDYYANPTVIDAQGVGRAVLIMPSQTVELRHLTIQNGVVLTSTSNVDGSGGGVYAGDGSTVTLEHVTVRDSVANTGGGIYAQQSADLSISNTTVRNNYALNRGGGINLKSSSTADIANSTFHDNIGGAGGGGIYLTGGSGLLTLENSTLSGNTGARGAGLRLDFNSSATVNNVTIANNKASNAALEAGISAGGVLTMSNSLVAGNTGGTGDCAVLSGGVATISFSLIEDGSCGIINNVNGNVIDTPEYYVLAPVVDDYDEYTGFSSEQPVPTWTHELPNTSVARNKGSTVTCTTHDQRDYVRTDGACDLGAFEHEGKALGAPAVLYTFIDGTTGGTDTAGIANGQGRELRRVINLANLHPDVNIIRTYAADISAPSSTSNLALDSALGDLIITSPVHIDFVFGTAATCPTGTEPADLMVLAGGVTIEFAAGSDGSSLSGLIHTGGDPAILVNGANDIDIRCNEISASDGHGVQVSNGQRVTIQQNEIFNNTLLGIKLGTGAGVTENDGASDSDGGSNGRLNFPEISGANLSGTVSGQLQTQPGTYTIDVYQNITCDASGNGEGETWLGSFATTINSGNFGFSGSVAAPVDGSHLSATATDSSGNTSEFGDCFEVGTVPTAAGMSEQLAVNSEQWIVLLVLWSVVGGLSSLVLWRRKKSARQEKF